MGWSGWPGRRHDRVSAATRVYRRRFKLRHNPSMRAPTRAKSDDQAGDVWTSMATEDIVLLGGHSTMAATAIQPTTTVSFRASGQKWIVASEVCRILGIRTDSVPQLIPEKDRSRAAVLTKGSVQSVTTITEAGFNLLVAQSAKPAAKALREWMVGEVLPSIPRPPAPKVPVGQGDFF